MKVLLTGATGFLGMETLARLLERTDAEVYALVRARDQAAATERIDAVLRQLYERPPAAAAARIRALPGDLAEPDLGLRAADRRAVHASVDTVIHCAAQIAFDLPLAEARAINVAGSRRILALCAQLRALRRAVHVSTAYVAGRHSGRFGEDDLDVGQDFRNSYEQSKFEAERELAANAAELPLVVARPSIVVGDRYSGWTPAFNVIYWPLRAFARGLLTSVPADPAGIVDVVPVDYVADALLHLAELPDARGTVHLVAADSASTNAQLVELACRRFGRPPPVLGVVGDVPRVEEAQAYIPYFDVETRFDDTRARLLLAPAGIRCGRIEHYFDAIIDYAVDARWGKAPISREAARRRLETSPGGFDGYVEPRAASGRAATG